MVQADESLGHAFCTQPLRQLLLDRSDYGPAIGMIHGVQHQPVDMHDNPLHTHPRVSASEYGLSRLAASK